MVGVQLRRYFSYAARPLLQRALWCRLRGITACGGVLVT